jgi:hypothetical protein
VLDGAPAAAEQGEPALAQAAQGTLEGVADTGIDVKFRAPGWLLDRDEDAQVGALIARIAEGGRAGQVGALAIEVVLSGVRR